MNSNWLLSLKRAKKSSLVQDNLKKVHYAFENDKEMVEEYNLETKALTRRAWRIKNELGGEDRWDIEIGEPENNSFKRSMDFIEEDVMQPCISRRITRTNLEWRIRNLPYPLEVYSVTAEPENRSITVRTTNKKYFKKISIPDLERIDLLPEQDRIKFTHKFNTLIISYKKPDQLVELEQEIFDEIQKVQPQNNAVDGCKPS